MVKHSNASHPLLRLTPAERKDQPEGGPMLKEISVKTRARSQFLDITAEIRAVVSRSGIKEGLCHIFVPHTTAAVTINEKADPDVARDIMEALERLAPEGDGYRHTEGNSDAHIKSTLTGASAFVPVSGGELALGTWQAVFFCEFDGPRSRRCLVGIIPSV